jgi:pyruvate/2-oxoacid:ferredoxin oxidoreductase beta subunit
MTSRQRSSKLCPGCGRPAVIKTLGKLYDSGILKQAIHDRSTHEWTEYNPSKRVGRNQQRREREIQSLKQRRGKVSKEVK